MLCAAHAAVRHQRTMRRGDTAQQLCALPLCAKCRGVAPRPTCAGRAARRHAASAGAPPSGVAAGPPQPAANQTVLLKYVNVCMLPSCIAQWCTAAHSQAPSRQRRRRRRTRPAGSVAGCSWPFTGRTDSSSSESWSSSGARGAGGAPGDCTDVRRPSRFRCVNLGFLACAAGRRAAAALLAATGSIREGPGSAPAVLINPMGCSESHAWPASDQGLVTSSEVHGVGSQTPSARPVPLERN